MCNTDKSAATPAKPIALDPTLYAAALAAVKAETEAHTAVLERRVSEARAALLNAGRNTVRYALPAGHVLQPLADLVADSLTIGEGVSGSVVIPAPVVALVSRASESSRHNVDALCLWSIRSRVGAEELAYTLAMESMAGQVARMQGS